MYWYSGEPAGRRGCLKRGSATKDYSGVSQKKPADIHILEISVFGLKMTQMMKRWSELLPDNFLLIN